MGDDIKVEMGFSVVWDLKINSVKRKSHKEKKGKELLDVRLGFEIFISLYIHIHMKHSKNNLGPFSVTSSIYLTHKTQHLKFHLMDFHWFCTIKTCSFITELFLHYFSYILHSLLLFLRHFANLMHCGLKKVHCTFQLTLSYKLFLKSNSALCIEVCVSFSSSSK